MSNDLYGTHASVLIEVLEENEVKYILEDGGGVHSTPIFIATGALVTTVEEDDIWRLKLRVLFHRSINWLLLGTWDEGHIFEEIPDLVFIDGKKATRGDRANQAFARKVPIIIAHDTEIPTYYGYDYIQDKGYTRMIYTDRGKQTTVWKIVKDDD